MSTEKTPEQIAEERYLNDAENPLYGLPSPYCSGQRQGYAACYREHVLNRPPVTVDGIMEVVKEWDKAFSVDPHPSPSRHDTVMSDLRSRLESYLTPNTKP